MSLLAIKKVVTGMVTPTVIPGVIFIAVGCAPSLVPEKMAETVPQIAQFWSSVFGFELKPKIFMPFVGTCKVVGIAGMWGLFGSTAEYITSLLYSVLCALATYQHYKLSEPIAPPIIIGFLCIIRLLLDYKAKVKSQ